MSTTIKALALMALGVIAGAQTTTISSVVNGPDGNPAAGTATITLSGPCQSGSTYVIPRQIQVPFTAGVFSVNLYPNTTCIPSTTSYAVQWQLTTPGRIPNQVWIVPASTTPIQIDAVLVPSPPSPSYAIPYTQITGLSSGYAPVGSVSGTVQSELALTDNSPSIFSLSLGDAILHNAQQEYGVTGANTYVGYHQMSTPNVFGPYNTSVGFESMNSITTGFDNTSVGVQTMPNLVDGFANLALGFQAGIALTHGSRNVFVGPNAGFQTNGSTSNLPEGTVAVGVEACYSGCNGSEDTAVGVDALEHSANAADVTAVGAYAMQHATDAAANATALGTFSLDNANGPGDTGLGFQSLQSNGTGSYNTAAGYNAFQANTTGSGNAGLGANVAVNNTTGSDNAALGQLALGNNVGGSNNVAVGYGAGYIQNNVNNSVFLGYQADESANNLSNVVAIGYQAQATQSNEVVIGNASISQTVLHGALVDSALVATPASSTSACSTGQFSFDDGYFYACVATDTWTRVAMTHSGW
jgi:hypothetical protein